MSRALDLMGSVRGPERSRQPLATTARLSGPVMVATFLQLDSAATPVPSGAMSSTAGSTLIVVPEPGSPAGGSVFGEVGIEPVDRGLVVQQHPHAAVPRLVSRAEPIRVEDSEPSQRRGGDAEGIGDLAAEVDVAW